MSLNLRRKTKILVNLRLDLSIEVHDRKFATKMFDNRDGTAQKMKFSIKDFFSKYLDSNIPSQIFYASI